MQSLFQVINKYAQTLLAQVKCLRSLQFFVTKCVFCLLLVAPGQVAIHVGAKGLPLLPGERAAGPSPAREGRRPALDPTHDTESRLAMHTICIQFAHKMQTLSTYCVSICRLNADFVHTLCFQYADLMQTLFLFTWNLFPHTN